MSGKKTIGVILSGAGYLDGAEIQEAVLCLLALDEAGVDVKVFAPDVKLAEINHLTAEPTGAERGVLLESARIVRGKVSDISKVNGADRPKHPPGGTSTERRSNPCPGRPTPGG